MASHSQYSAVKHIKQSTKDLVSGFIRLSRQQLPHQNPYYDIPTIIVYETLLYFNVREFFKEHSDDITLSKHNLVATVTGNLGPGSYCTIYGNVEIELDSNTVYEWTLTIHELFFWGGEGSANDELSIGITTKHCDKLDVHMIDTDHDAFCMDADGEIECKYPTLNAFDGKAKCKKGDVVKMQFDSKQMTLRWYLNAKTEPIAETKVEFNEDNLGPPFFAVSMEANKGTCIELNEFKICDTH